MLIAGAAVLAALAIAAPALLNLSSQPSGDPHQAPAARSSQAPADQPAAPSTSPVPSGWQTSSRQDRPPAPVSNLRLSSNTWHNFTVAWDASPDAYEGLSYRILLNGSAVGSTEGLTATINWVRGTERHLVQVEAVGAAGLVSELRSIVVIPPADPSGGGADGRHRPDRGVDEAGGAPTPQVPAPTDQAPSDQPPTDQVPSDEPPTEP
ncbi:hypothetical protein CGZ92_04080, partial [Parenemella sanctibonifatiensis]